MSVLLDCLIVLSEEFVAVDDDNLCTASFMADKDTMEFVQSSKNIVGADSDDENELNYVVALPTSSEMKNIMKNMRSYLDAHFIGRSGVISDGLSHLAIPDGWKWGGTVSKHFPVWAELFIEEESTNSNVPPLLNVYLSILCLERDFFMVIACKASYADYFIGTSSHAPQGPRSRILSWAQKVLVLKGCCATELSYVNRDVSMLTAGRVDTKFYPRVLCATQSRNLSSCSVTNAVNSGPFQITPFHLLQPSDMFWMQIHPYRTFLN
ncbi:hypothetical protein TNCV_91891 [Trichonephila clavipes]|nr:hypothetical protein TNCV_91891 [Trichonephila clavipes]